MGQQCNSQLSKITSKCHIKETMFSQTNKDVGLWNGLPMRARKQEKDGCLLAHH